jgi:hypothetical protein
LPARRERAAPGGGYWETLRFTWGGGAKLTAVKVPRQCPLYLLVKGVGEEVRRDRRKGGARREVEQGSTALN